MAKLPVGDERVGDDDLISMGFVGAGERRSKFDLMHELQEVRAFDLPRRNPFCSFQLRVRVVLRIQAQQEKFSKHSEAAHTSKSEVATDAGLQVYYCGFCGAFALIIGTPN